MSAVPATSLSSGKSDSSDRLGVMVVDDSAVIRGIFRRTLEADPDIEVVASVSNGQQAIDALAKQPVDVVVLDIEMPVMDGMTALPKLLEIAPDVKIIMASTLTEKNAAISLEALQMGAADYIPKPTAKYEIHSADSFKRELVEKIKALGGHSRRTLNRPAPRAASVPLAANKKAEPAAPVAKRSVSNVPPRIISIGSSTGGPQALFKVFEGLKGNIDHLPVVIAQHMPKAFTGILAEHLSKVADARCGEGIDGEPLEAGRIYVAPGDFHMYIEKSGTGHVIRLNQEPAENYCRPSVEPLFRSVAKEFGSATLALMLTGMGHDGLDASETLVDTGATLIAQDEESSVVWGMPGAVANAGLCAEILPIDQIAPRAINLMRRA
ncbi:MAG: two-component system chemotaxis response regulator CheB [Paracoccaceae bacterium]|jgi:two-component system chemotaxis response regulator CheB